jgi:hypothetical protein
MFVRRQRLPAGLSHLIASNILISRVHEFACHAVSGFHFL